MNLVAVVVVKKAVKEKLIVVLIEKIKGRKQNDEVSNKSCFNKYLNNTY